MGATWPGGGRPDVDSERGVYEGPRTLMHHSVDYEGFVLPGFWGQRDETCTTQDLEVNCVSLMEDALSTVSWLPNEESERRGNNLKGFRDLNPKTKTRIWP